MGRRKHPVFGLVAADSRAPRDGRFIEDLGRYEPVAEPALVTLDADRVIYWLDQGAQPSDTVRNLLHKEGVLLRRSLRRQGADEEAVEAAIAEFKERQEAKRTAAGKTTPAERRAAALKAERAAAQEKAAELAKARAEREAELQRQREEAEAAERAAAEEARAQAAADAADSAALTEAADAPADAPAAGDDRPAEAEAVDAGPADGAPVAEAQAEAQAAAEAEGADAAVAETTEAAVADEAPDAAEEQPAVETQTAAEVADRTGGEVADQTEAAAEQADTVEADAAETSAAEAADTPAEPAANADAQAADDLTRVNGIGPKYSEVLAGAGVTTFAALAETSAERIQEILSEAGSSAAGNEDTWPEQARLLAAGDDEGHAAYLESQK